MFQFYLQQIRTVIELCQLASPSWLILFQREKLVLKKWEKQEMFVLIASSDINSFTDLYDINNIYRKIINFTASMDNLEQQKIQSN